MKNKIFDALSLIVIFPCLLLIALAWIYLVIVGFFIHLPSRLKGYKQFRQETFNKLFYGFI